MRGSSSTRSRGKLTTTSLCFRFTEFSSTVNFVPSCCAYLGAKLIAEKRKRSTLTRKHGTAHELKSSRLSVMDARGLLAKGDRRDGHLWDHICADQWATAENSSFEPASSCFARSD